MEEDKLHGKSSKDEYLSEGSNNLSLSDNQDDKIVPYQAYEALKKGFIEERKKMEDRVWLDVNLNKFDEVLRENFNSTITSFSENIITYLAKLTNAVYGAFFVVNLEKKTVKATAGYACTPETMDRVKFNVGEGLIGQVAKSKEILTLDNVETQLDSSIGRINASFLIVSPLIFNDAVYGIIELNHLIKLKPRYLTLIERISRSTAAVLQSIINNQNTKRLLIESLQQSEDYKLQSQELEKLNQEVEKLQSQLNSSTESVNNLQVVEPHLAQNGASTEIYQNGVAEEITKLKTELEASQSLVANLQEEIKEKNELVEPNPNEELEKKLEEQAQEIQSLQQQLETQIKQTPPEDDSAEKLSHMQKELDKRRTQILALEEELMAKNADISTAQEMQKELETRRVQILALEEELKTKVAEAADTQELEQLKEKFSQSQTQIQELQAQLVTQQAEAQQTEDTEQISKLRGLEEALRIKEIELQKANTKIREAELAVTDMKNETNEQLAEVARFNQVKDELEKTQQKLQTSQDALYAKEDELQQILAKVSAGEELEGNYQQEWTSNSGEDSEQTTLELEKKNKHLEKEIDRKEKELNMAKETIKWKDAEIDRQDEAILERKKEIQAIKKEFEEVKSENLQHLEEIVKLGKDLKQKEYDLESSSQQLSEADNSQELNFLKEEVQQKNVAIEDLTNRVNTLLENKQESENFQEALTQKDHEIAHLQERIKSIEVNPEIEFLKDDVKQKNQVIEELSHRLNTSLLNQKENENLKETLAQKEAEINALQQQAQSGATNTDQGNSFAQEELSQKTQAIEELSARLNKLLPLQREYDLLKLQLEQKEQKIQELQEQSNTEGFNPEAEFLKKEVQEKDAAMTVLKDQIRILSNNEEARRLRSTLEKEEAKVEALQKQIEELSQQESQVSANPEELASKEAELQKAQEQIQALQSRESSLGETLSSLQNQIQDASANLEQTMTSLEEKEEQISNHYIELEKMKSQLRKKEDELLVSQYLLNQQQDTTELNVELENLKKALINKENIIRLKDEELQKLINKPQNTLADADLLRLQEELDGKKLEIENLRAYIQDHEQGTASSNPEDTTLQKELEEKNSEIENLKSYIDSQQKSGSDIELLKQELKAREETLTDVRAQLDMQSQTSKEAVQRLNQEIDSLQARLSLREKTLEENQAEIAKNQQETQTSIQSLNELLQQKEEEIEKFKQETNNPPQAFADSDEAMQNLQNQLQLKEEELSQITERQLLRIEALASLKEELKQKEVKIKLLEEAIQETGGSSDDTKHLEQMIDQRNTENQQLAESLSKLRDQLLAKDVELNQIKEEAEKQPSPSQHAELQKKLEELEALQTNLKAQEEEMSSQTQSMQKYNHEVKALKIELKSKESENLKQAEKIQHQERQILAKQEEMLQKQKELTSLFNKINTAFATIEIDMEGNILSINNKFLMLLGLKVEDIERQPYHSIIDQEFANSSEYKVLWEGLKMGVSQTVENLICVGSKQKEILMNVTYIPIIGENGKPYEIVKLVNNLVRSSLESVTKASNGNAAIAPALGSHQDQERLRAVNNSFIIQELDLDGNITEVNKQFLTFLGYDEKEVLGQHHRNFIDVTERSSDTYLDIIRGLSSGNFASQVFKYVGKEGERVRLRSYFNPILDENQNPQKVMVISQFVN